MITPTPSDIAELAFIRRYDPALALSIAEQSGKAHDQSLTSKICGVEAPKETTQNVKRSTWRPTHGQADVKTTTIRPDDPEIDRLLTQLGL